MRIGILGHQFILWGGGVDFLRMICGCLMAADSRIEVHVLFPTRGPLNTLRIAKSDIKRTLLHLAGRDQKVIDTPKIEEIKKIFSTVGNNIYFHEIDIGFSAIRKAFKHHRLDVLLPAFHPLPFGKDLPWIGYLYDMQHKHLPHLFSSKEIECRDRDFGLMVAQAPLILVNSKAAMQDIHDNFSSSKGKVFSLPFSPAPSKIWFDLDIVNTKIKYKISKTYFIICNQFWKHKNHTTAIHAFSNFVKQYDDVDLVCTGATHDYRDSTYFDSLLKIMESEGISKRIKVLGLIPKNDQIALMRGSIALIQPTLFEGGPGGGAAYDAVGLGVPCILSDIPVNKEINEDDVCFFKVGDPHSLYEQMLSAYLNQSSRPPVDATNLMIKGQKRLELCGQVLIESIHHLRCAAVS